MTRPRDPRGTHYEGCPCHEQGWADTANSLRRERDDARTDAVDNAHEAAKLREALRLITTWTTPHLATVDTVGMAHNKAREVLALSDF